MVLLLIASGVALAAPVTGVRPLRFEYTREGSASVCPDEAAVRSAVAARVGFDAFDATARAALRVVVTPMATGFRAEIGLIDEADTRRSRQLDGVEPDCTDLASALPFALSVAVESFSATPTPPPPTPVLVPAPTRAAPAPAAPVAQAESWRGAASVRVEGLLGAAPSLAGEVGLGAGMLRQSLSLWVEARFVFPASVTVAGGRVETTSFAGELVPCFEVGPLSACGLVGAGALWSRAIDLADARSAITPLVSLGARAQVSLPVSRFLRVGAFAQLRGALTRVVLKVGPDDVWSMPILSGGGGLSLIAAWPVTEKR